VLEHALAFDEDQARRPDRVDRDRVRPVHVELVAVAAKKRL
jgi:hypothetical protein